MTQSEVNEKSKVIAEYMGLLKGDPEDYEPEWFEQNTHYHDRIEWIYPVWLRCEAEFQKLTTTNFTFMKHRNAAQAALLSGDLPALRDSLYQCILLIQKKEENDLPNTKR